jgi:hypothetical protein
MKKQRLTAEQIRHAEQVCARIEAAREAIHVAKAISHALTAEPDEERPLNYQLLCEHIAKMLGECDVGLSILVDDLNRRP